MLNDVLISFEEGEIDALKVTGPENPPVGEAVTVVDAEPPGATVPEVGDAVILKSPAAKMKGVLIAATMSKTAST